MAKERESKQHYEEDAAAEPARAGERSDPGDEELEEAAEAEDESAFEQPFCPRCGWHNTRPSHTSNALDMMVRMFGFRPYRCRSCGNRFRSMRRARKS